MGDANKIKGVEELEVYKLGHNLVLEIYKTTKTFPADEVYGLSSQMRRAATSVGANLAEGANKSSKKEFKRHVNIAKGSTGEMLYHLLVAKDLGYLSTQKYRYLQEKYSGLIKMLEKLGQALK